MQKSHAMNLLPEALRKLLPMLPSAALLHAAVDHRAQQPAPASNPGTYTQHLGYPEASGP